MSRGRSDSEAAGESQGSQRHWLWSTLHYWSYSTDQVFHQFIGFTKRGFVPCSLSCSSRLLMCISFVRDLTSWTHLCGYHVCIVCRMPIDLSSARDRDHICCLSIYMCIVAEIIRVRTLGGFLLISLVCNVTVLIITSLQCCGYWWIVAVVMTHKFRGSHKLNTTILCSSCFGLWQRWHEFTDSEFLNSNLLNAVNRAGSCSTLPCHACWQS